LLQLPFEEFEQRERVGRAAGESGNHATSGQPTHFAGITLHDRIAYADLAIAADRNSAITAN
jgi:hypothetical protein